MNSQEIDWLLLEKYHGEKSAAFFADIARLEAGEPLAYLIGHTPFLNTTIHLTSKPLIPRPETEYWVEKCLAVLRDTQLRLQRPLRILDLCAGSGAIGVALGHNLPTAYIDFIELDAQHLPTITQNCTQNGITASRVRIEKGNLLRDIRPDPSRHYDCIVSNPPYIDASLDRTEESVKKYEPALALYGGEAGMELITEIIRNSVSYLAPAGELWLEHEPEQSELITAIARPHFAVTTHKDQYGILRFSQLVLQ